MLPLRFQPDAVIVWIGDNDLQENSSPSDLSGFIFAALEAIAEFCPSIRTIFISPILPRYNGTSKYLFEKYNALALDLNKLLKQEVQNYQVQDGRSPTIHFRRLIFTTPSHSSLLVILISSAKQDTLAS